MKLNKKIIILFVFLLMVTSGCTKRFQYGEENAKKSYTSNILCKPTEETNIEVYNKSVEQTGIKLEDLPECKNFKITTGGYEGLWTSIFVKPLSWLIIKVGLIFNNYGLAIMIVGLLLRFAMFPLSQKSASMSKNMKKAKPELDKLEKKYANKNDQESMQAKAQETMFIYKKHDINPLSGCLTAVIQLPIFFAIYEAIQRVPVFFEGSFLKVFHLGMTPLEGFAVGNYWYILLIVIIIVTTYFSFKNVNMGAMDDSQGKQMKFMNMFMVIFIGIVSFSLPSALAFYWIVSTGFTLVQNIITQKDTDSKPRKLREVK